jgi:hypothetical protein
MTSQKIKTDEILRLLWDRLIKNYEVLELISNSWDQENQKIMGYAINLSEEK